MSTNGVLTFAILVPSLPPFIPCFLVCGEQASQDSIQKKPQNEHFYLLPALHCLQQVGPSFGIGLIFILIVAAGDLLVLEGLRGVPAAHGCPHVDGLGKRRHLLARE